MLLPRHLPAAVLPALLLAAALAGCDRDLECASAEIPCGDVCVRPRTDAAHCGACGVACAAGQVCDAGACVEACGAGPCADVHVACYATGEVVPLEADLSPAGTARAVPTGPTVLAAGPDALYSANGFPAAGVSVIPKDPALAVATTALSGTDLQDVLFAGGAVLAANAGAGTLAVLGPAGALLDELPMPRQENGPNPHGIAVDGTTGWVALYGASPSASGQSIAKLDLAGLATCATAGPPCAAVVRELDLLAVAGAFDAPGLPFPSEVVATGGRVYVTLANLQLADAGGFQAYIRPAGPGRLAVVNPAADDAVSIVDLGAGCGNPGAMALEGTTLWIACGSFSFPGEAPPVLLPVDLSGAAPAVGEALPVPGFVPGRLAFCGGTGYLTDQASGRVLRFDPAGRTIEPPVEVCPVLGFAWAADVACGR
jgi:hypothetical protein